MTLFGAKWFSSQSYAIYNLTKGAQEKQSWFGPASVHAQYVALLRYMSDVIFLILIVLGTCYKYSFTIHVYLYLVLNARCFYNFFLSIYTMQGKGIRSP